ncbi:hypothetical protein BKP54_01570 [Ensifer sp. 1H6]|nr:hypothetical protein BKP54_01570 [Ensifer sp. 1H6]
MFGPVEVAGGECFNHATGIHDENAVAEIAHKVQVVTDHDEANAAVAHEAVEDIQHLKPDGNVERGGGFVGDDEIWVCQKHHRDHYTLTHAAGYFMRVLIIDPLRVTNLDGFQHGERLVTGLCLRASEVAQIGLCHLVANTPDRVEREFGILEDH